MKTLLIIQSRMESKRLPNKSLFPINKIIVFAAKRVKSKVQTIVATTTRESRRLCKILKNKINYFRGSSYNVRKRFLECSKKLLDEDIIVRLTADNCFQIKTLLRVSCLKLMKKQNIYT